MEQPPPDRAILLALAALYELAGEANKGPLPPSLSLRALLALVHAASDGSAEPYQDFWRACRACHSGERDGTAGYLRSSYSRTAWSNIVRSLGVEPQSAEFMRVIEQLAAARRNDAGEAIAHSRIVQIVRDAVYVREVIATKGHPRSQRGRELAARIVRDLS